MRSIRTILVDDERGGRTRLRRMLQQEADLEILAECSDGYAAVKALREHAPDLVFLDINMPGMDGFAVLDTLGPESQPKAVIFVTGYDEHAVRAFDACALDYVLKPVSAERLGKALSRARERLQVFHGVASAKPEAPVPSPPGEARPDIDSTAARLSRFTVRRGARVSFIAPADIAWIEAAGNYAILHATDGSHVIRETMSSLETQLSDHTFLRVSRSAIVNLHRVKELHASPDGENAVLLADGQSIRISRSLREVAALLAAL